ncbi:MAG: hypothetical protein JKY55_11510 [Aliivibrio sp.]|uniref:hypothetical protein n=1 Tax=Aliivibrio sp. TaxID=1872443 RepID=UPI001A39EDDB|nr:hypothetical protein [Aliivibrio sp.]
MELVEWHKERLWYYQQSSHHLFSRSVEQMHIVRLDNSKLVIHSPVELTERLRLLIDGLGEVLAVIYPTYTSTLHLSDWWLQFPNALFYATTEVIQKRSEITFDNSLSSKTPISWKHQLLQTPILGSSQPTHMVFCDPISRTLLLDTLFVSRSSVSLPLFQRRYYQNHFMLRSSIQEVLTWPFDTLLSSNGLVIKSDAKQQFYEAFKWASLEK